MRSERERETRCWLSGVLWWYAIPSPRRQEVDREVNWLILKCNESVDRCTSGRTRPHLSSTWLTGVQNSRWPNEFSRGAKIPGSWLEEFFPRTLGERRRQAPRKLCLHERRRSMGLIALRLTPPYSRGNQDSKSCFWKNKIVYSRSCLRRERMQQRDNLFFTKIYKLQKKTYRKQTSISRQDEGSPKSFKHSTKDVL